MSYFIVHLRMHQKKYSVHCRLRNGMKPTGELRVRKRRTSEKGAWLSDGTRSRLVRGTSHTELQEWKLSSYAAILHNRHDNLKERKESPWEKKKGRQLRCTLESKQQILPVHGRSFFGRREIFWLCLAIEDSSCVPQRVPLNTICSHLLLSAYYVSNKWLDLLSLLNMSLTCRSSSTRKRSKTSSRWD